MGSWGIYDICPLNSLDSQVFSAQVISWDGFLCSEILSGFPFRVVFWSPLEPTKTLLSPASLGNKFHRSANCVRKSYLLSFLLNWILEASSDDSEVLELEETVNTVSVISFTSHSWLVKVHCHPTSVEAVLTYSICSHTESRNSWGWQATLEIF